jgi:hypothetical protein
VPTHIAPRAARSFRINEQDPFGSIQYDGELRCHLRIPCIVHRNVKQIDCVVLLQMSSLFMYGSITMATICNSIIIIICGTSPRYSRLDTAILPNSLVRVEYSYYRRCLFCGPPIAFHNCCYLYSTIVPHSLQFWLQNPPATAVMYVTNAG